MRILIVGAGATGGYYGARLLAAGRDVTFLVRPATAARLASEGLHLLSPTGDLHLPPPPTVLTPTETFDLIVLSCKAPDLPSAIDSIAPAVGPTTLILPLLNGMAHMPTLDARFGPAHILGGTTNVSAVREPSGFIRHFEGSDRLLFGSRTAPSAPRMQALASILAHANFESHLRPDILQDMWDKWVAIATGASLTCLLRASIADIVAAGGAPLVHELLLQNATIASAEGFPPAPDYLAGIAAFLTRPDSLFKSSMLRDIESNHPIESQQIAGDLLALAHRHNLPAPILTIVVAHLRAYEHHRQRESLSIVNPIPV